MIALYIIAGILLLVIILMNCPAAAHIKYYGGEFDVKVKYLWFIIFPVKEKPPKVSEKSRSKKKKVEIQEKSDDDKSKALDFKNQAENNEDDKELLTGEIKSKSKKKSKFEKEKQKQDLKEKIQLVKTILVSSKKGLKRIVKGIYISNLKFNAVVADEDAAEAAINYGKISAVVYNSLSFLRTFFTVSVERVNISCRYNSSESIFEGECTVKLRPATVLCAAFSILCHFLINNIKMKLNEKKLKEAD